MSIINTSNNKRKEEEKVPEFATIQKHAPVECLMFPLMLLKSRGHIQTESQFLKSEKHSWVCWQTPERLHRKNDKFETSLGNILRTYNWQK